MIRHFLGAGSSTVHKAPQNAFFSLFVTFSCYCWRGQEWYMLSRHGVMVAKVTIRANKLSPSGMAKVITGIGDWVCYRKREMMERGLNTSEEAGTGI